MPKYIVIETSERYLEVDADSELEALELAFETNPMEWKDGDDSVEIRALDPEKGT